VRRTDLPHCYRTGMKLRILREMERRRMRVKVRENGEGDEREMRGK
jgi:hypothetical protein